MTAEHRQAAEYKEYMRQYQREWYLRNKAKVSAASKEWQRNNPERTRTIQKRWRKTHPERAREGWKKYEERHPNERREQILRHRDKYPARNLLRITRSRANKLGRQFALTEQWIAERLPLGCALSGAEFDMTRGNGGRRIRAPSVDRIDSSRDYVPGNCRLICVGLNLGLQEWGWENVASLWKEAIAREKDHVGISLHGEQRP